MTVQKQLDGAVGDTSDEDGSDVSDDNIDGDDDDDLDKEDDDEAEGDGGPEDEPLNSDDDVSEEEQADLFDTDNVVVCQYDKVRFCCEFYCEFVNKIFNRRCIFLGNTDHQIEKQMEILSERRHHEHRW